MTKEPTQRSLDRLSLRGLADLITVLPFQLGFAPKDSLVVVCLQDLISQPGTGRGARGVRTGMVERVDLPPPALVDEAAVGMVPALVRAAPLAVCLLAYEERAGDGDLALHAMARACARWDIPVTDRVAVHAGRWFRVETPQGRRPDGGHRVPAPAEVPAVAGFVFRGVAPATSREEVAARLRPCAPSAAGSVTAAAEERLLARDRSARSPGALQRLRGEELTVWATILSAGPEPLGAAEVATAAVSLADVQLRDALIARLCPGQLDLASLDPGLVALMSERLPPVAAGPGGSGGDDAALIDRLVRLCPRVPPEWAPPLLSVLAAATWWRGDGALTRMALEQALVLDREYRLAGLLMRMVDLSIRPGRAAG